MVRKIQEQMFESGAGPLRAYRDLVIGRPGWGALIRYEVAVACKYVPGALGLLFRRWLWRGLFAAQGRSCVIGEGVTIRHPGSIRMGDRVVLDDGAVLDAKQGSIRLGSDIFVSRGAAISCKGGEIELDHHVTIGPFAFIQSVGSSRVRIGHHVMIAAYVYVIGCGDYRTERLDVPMYEQGLLPGRGIEIGSDVWIGTHAVICDGARIGDGAIIGAHSLVRGEIPPRAVAFGCPAVVRRWRGAGDPGSGAPGG